MINPNLIIKIDPFPSVLSSSVTSPSSCSTISLTYDNPIPVDGLPKSSYLEVNPGSKVNLYILKKYQDHYRLFEIQQNGGLY